MLQYIRERAQGILAWIIVGFIVLAFSFWGIQEYLRADQDAPVAEVNDTAISKQLLQLALEQQRNRLQQMFGSNFRPEMFSEAAMKEPVLEQIIEREVLIRSAVDAGLGVADSQLAAQIRSTEAFQDEKGQFSRAAYESALRNAGYSVQRYESELRRDLLVSQLMSAVTQTSFITPTEEQQYLRLQNQERDFGYLVFPVSNYLDRVQITDEEIAAYYEANKAAYVEPEKVQLEYVDLSVQGLSRDIVVSDDEVKSYYDTHQDEYSSPEERRASHILIRVAEDANEETVNAARAKAEAARAAIMGGKDFAAVAREQSEDVGSAQQGGDVGYFSQTGSRRMAPAFEAAVFGMEKGTISEPVRTNYGFHIIKLDDIHPATVLPLAEVQERVRTKIREEQARERFYGAAEKLRNLAYEHPESLEEAGKALNLAVQTSPYISRKGGPGLFGNPKITEAAFSEDVLERGINSTPVDVSSDQQVVLRVKDRKPEAPKPLAEVSDQISRKLQQQKAGELATKAADEAAAALAAGQVDPAEYAKQHGLDWKRQEAKRNDAQLPPPVIQLVFGMTRPEETKPRVDQTSMSDGNQAVVLLYSVKEGEIPADQKVPDAVKSAQANSLFKGVVDTLRSQADVRIYRDRL